MMVVIGKNQNFVFDKQILKLILMKNLYQEEEELIVL